MGARIRSAVVLGVLACSAVGAANAAAQSGRGNVSASTLGLSVESWHIEDDVALTMIALHTGRIVDRGTGVDFTVAAWPEGLIEGGLLLVSDLGLGIGVVRDDASASIRAGFSGLVAVGAEAGTLLPGVHAGITAVIPSSVPVGLRLDGVFRAFRVGHSAGFLGMEFVPTFSIGFGVTRVSRS